MANNPFQSPKVRAGEAATLSADSSFFVERRVENDQQVVVLKYVAISNWLRWATLLLILVTFTVSREFFFAWVAAFVMMFATALPYWPITFQLKRQMRIGSITAAGSKYSLSNPLTYRWSLEQ